MVLKDNLLNKINEIYKDISTHPEYSQKLNEKLQKNLFFEANYQSYIMDSPKTTNDKRISIPDRSGYVKNEVEKISKWAIDNFKDNLNETYLISLAQQFDPHNFNYRTTRAKLKDTNLVIPGPHKIENEIQTLFYDLNTKSYHPLEKAILTHLHLIRIQPFIDGNKRTARMLQNTILMNKGLPPIRVGRAEGSYYKDLMLDAIKGYNNRVSEDPHRNSFGYNNSEEEKRFFKYLSSKELESLGVIQQNLALSRKYKINFRTNEIDILFRAKKNIKNNIQTNGKDAKVRFDKQNKEIIVTGDIDKDTVQIALKAIKSLHKNDYEINILV
jgi:fido (protein-threonine AMPylation protein)